MAGKPTGKYSADVLARVQQLREAKLEWAEVARIIAAEFKLACNKDTLRMAYKYWESNVPAPEPAIPERLPSTESPADILHQLILRGNVKAKDARERLGCNTQELETLVAEMRQDLGLNVRIHGGIVELLKAIPTGGEFRLPKDYLQRGKWHEFGVISDNHLGSQYARLDVLNAAYDFFEAEGIKVVYNAGNMLDGYVKRINHFELLPGMTGYDAQCAYLADVWPRKDGIETHFITGDDHEGWWVKDIGANIGENMEDKARRAGRDDLKWLGHVEADVIYPAPDGETRIKIMHPGGGSSYALSYTPQKIVESFSGGEKPQVLIIGHYHKADYLYYRNVHIVQAGTTQDQSAFMRKKKLAAHLGFWTCRFMQAEDGSIMRFQSEFVPFFDRPYYEVRDWKTKYKMW